MRSIIDFCFFKFHIGFSVVNYNDKAIIRIFKKHLIKISRLVFEFVTGFILTPCYDHYFKEKNMYINSKTKKRKSIVLHS